jgi:hypothetical protein
MHPFFKIIAFLILLPIFSIQAQVNTYQKIYAADSVGYMTKTILTRDSGFLSCGNFRNNIICTKFDAKGNEKWNRIYEADSGLEATYIRQTSDGGFILTGLRLSLGLSNIYLLKTDSLGNLTWSKKIRDTVLLSINVSQENDNGYLIHGCRGYAANKGQVLIKTDSFGQIQWAKRYNLDYYGGGHWIKESFKTSDGGNFLIGDNPLSILRTDSLGNCLWSKSISANEQLKYNGGMVNSNDEIMIFGKYGLYGSYYMKLNGSAAFQWGQKISATLEINGLAGNGSKGFAWSALETKIVGNQVKRGVTLFLTDTAGIINSLSTINEPTIEDVWVNGVFQQVDMGYLISCDRWSQGGTSPSSFYFIKTDSTLDAGCFSTYPVYTFQPLNTTISTISASAITINPISESTTITTRSVILPTTIICTSLNVEQMNQEKPLIMVYPNPSDGLVNIKSDEKIISVKIFNEIGKLVKEINETNKPQPIDLRYEAPGLYFYDVKLNNNKTGKGKIIIN